MVNKLIIKALINMKMMIMVMVKFLKENMLVGSYVLYVINSLSHCHSLNFKVIKKLVSNFLWIYVITFV